MSNQRVKGAAGGAMSGAAIGSMVAPGIGTFVGGAIGGLAGYFSSGEDDARKKIAEEYRRGYSDFRNNQKSLIQRLDDISQGRGPSVANQQMQSAMGRNSAGMAAAAASGRGNAGAAAQSAMTAGATSNAQIGEAAMAARIDERNRALELYGMNVSQARQMDEQHSFNAANLELGVANTPGEGDKWMAAGLAGVNQYAGYAAQERLNASPQRNPAALRKRDQLEASLAASQSTPDGLGYGPAYYADDGIGTPGNRPRRNQPIDDPFAPPVNPYDPRR